MEVFGELPRAAAIPARPVHLAIGMFDGVHRGHRAVIGAARQAARSRGELSGVLTFWPHPSAVLRPENRTPQIYPPEIKRRLLEELGIDFLIEQPFTREYAANSAREFVRLLKNAIPALRAVYVGENWRFGRGREGDVATLATEAALMGVQVRSLPRVQAGGEPISSSRLRELIAAGEMVAAGDLLGSPYESEGVVQGGRKLGRTLGFPTLNFRWQPELRPRFAIYAVTACGAEGWELPGVASYGVRPTVETEGEALLEVHVLVPTTLSYGDRVRVRWIEFLRAEEKFPDLESLRAQIRRDAEGARAFLARRMS